MAIDLVPLPLPASADASKLAGFGREVRGLNPASLSDEELQQIQEALYTYDILLFRDANLTPEQQYALTKAFDPESENYGHGNNKVDADKQSVLHFFLKTIPRVPQVQLIGNGTIYDHEGVEQVHLTHPHHSTFHKTRVSPEDEAESSYTRFYRGHMDAALYDLSPPKVTTLYGLTMPVGIQQIVRYDDGTGDELPVPLGTTAFVSGKTMFDILPPELKSLAVRSKVKYSPHPFVWMAPARAMSTGLGIECDGQEIRLNELPAWEESKQKVYPVTWKNPVTDDLHFQVHPCGASELFVEPIPKMYRREGALYADGAHITDLKVVRELLYKMQRPAISPELIYPHDWREKDLVLFHNRGVMHTAVGSFRPDQIRIFHQCNLAASDEPIGPTAKDIEKWT